MTTTDNRATAGARRKGAEAHASGTPRDANPYADRSATRAVRRAWFEGWDRRANIVPPSERV